MDSVRLEADDLVYSTHLCNPQPIPSYFNAALVIVSLKSYNYAYSVSQEHLNTICAWLSLVMLIV